MSERSDLIRAFGADVRSFLSGLLGTLEGAGATSSAGRAASGKEFPESGVDGFLSHFILTLQFHGGERRNEFLSLSLPSAVQTVARSAPFAYRGDGSDRAELPVPKGAELTRSLAEEDFLITPPKFFERGKETVFLQILNLDARADTAIGPIRIILGETFRKEYPDVFEPSFGAAQSLGDGGFPARLFFSPNAVIETPVGAFKTRAKALVGAEISAFPPIGSHPSLLEPVQLDSVDELRAAAKNGTAVAEAAATISALSHPIDAAFLGEDPFTAVQQSIARQG